MPNLIKAYLTENNNMSLFQIFNQTSLKPKGKCSDWGWKQNLDRETLFSWDKINKWNVVMLWKLRRRRI